MQKISQRTSMPFDDRGAISPPTQKSVPPFNNVPTIEDILNGNINLGDYYPHAGGEWSPGQDPSKSYREEGDDYKRVEKDWNILNKMLDGGERSRQQWKVRVPGGHKIFMSFELAQQYIRSKNIPFSYVQRVAQKTQGNQSENERVKVISESINKCLMVESIDYQKGIRETGSAFCVFLNYFITCAHVIKKYNKNHDIGSNYFEGAIVNVVQNGIRHSATVIDVDAKKDIALILCNDVNVEAMNIDTEFVVGEEVIAIGSPHGFENNVSVGVLGSLNRKLFFYEGAPEYMFVDLAIFPGNSGGPVIRSSNGGVIGVITMVVSESGEYGLNAALPSNYIVDLCAKNIKGFAGEK
jgi:S1-C subfamily serine protease